MKDASSVRGSGVASGQVVSQCWTDVVDSALEEDISGNTNGRHLRRKHIIDPPLSKSHIVIEIADGDDPRERETMGLCRLGEPGVVGTRSVPPSVSGDAPSAAGPSS